MAEYLSIFIFFFAVIDPIGTIPVFIAVTRPFDHDTKKKIALRAVMTATLVLLFFMIGGEIILTQMNIPLPAFEIAGGIVLLLFALTMIFGESKPEEEVKMINQANDTAIYPLAIPSIASPGAMLAAVLLTKNDEYTLWEQSQTALIMLLVLLIVYIFCRLASRIYKLIGDAGAGIISRIMGLILASVAVASMLEGIVDYFGL